MITADAGLRLHGRRKAEHQLRALLQELQDENRANRFCLYLRSFPLRRRAPVRKCKASSNYAPVEIIAMKIITLCGLRVPPLPLLLQGPLKILLGQSGTLDFLLFFSSGRYSERFLLEASSPGRVGRQ